MKAIEILKDVMNKVQKGVEAESNNLIREETWHRINYVYNLQWEKFTLFHDPEQNRFLLLIDAMGTERDFFWCYDLKHSISVSKHLNELKQMQVQDVRVINQLLLENMKK